MDSQPTIPQEDIDKAVSGDLADHISERTKDAFEALDRALSVKPSTKADVIVMDASMGSAISTLQNTILTDAQTFEGKENVQKKLSRIIEMGMTLLGEIEKDCKNGGVQPRTIEVFATLMNSTTVACHQLMNLHKMAAEAYEYNKKEGGPQVGASLTETHTRTITMGPRDMSELIAKAQKSPSVIRDIGSSGFKIAD
jgi:hypothetical protein